MPTKHRPPFSVFMIKELIEIGKHDDAMRMCDENEDFYNERAEEMRDLFVKAKAAQIMIPVDAFVDDLKKSLDF